MKWFWNRAWFFFERRRAARQALVSAIRNHEHLMEQVIGRESIDEQTRNAIRVLAADRKIEVR